MRVLVVGASGATGGRVMRLALDRGDEVTALVRRADSVTVQHDRLRVVSAVVTTDPAAVEASAVGHELVVSTLGSPLRGPTRHDKIMAAAMTTLRRAAEASQARLVAMFAYGSGATAATAPAAIRLLGATALREDFADLDRAAALLRGSRAAWTAAHFGALTDEPRSGWSVGPEDSRPSRYRISRWDVADALLSVGEDPGFIGRSVVLSGHSVR